MLIIHRLGRIQHFETLPTVLYLRINNVGKNARKPSVIAMTCWKPVPPISFPFGNTSKNTTYITVPVAIAWIDWTATWFTLSWSKHSVRMIPIVIPTMGAVAKTPIETIKFLFLVFNILKVTAKICCLYFHFSTEWQSKRLSK